VKTRIARRKVTTSFLHLGRVLEILSPALQMIFYKKYLFEYVNNQVGEWNCFANYRGGDIHFGEGQKI